MDFHPIVEMIYCFVYIKKKKTYTILKVESDTQKQTLFEELEITE